MKQKHFVFAGWALFAIAVLVAVNFHTDYRGARLQYQMHWGVANYLVDFTNSLRCFESEQTCLNIREDFDDHKRLGEYTSENFRRKSNKLGWALIAVFLLALGNFGWLAYRTKHERRKQSRSE